MDATHFRHRAARAREMAQSGDDVRLSRMLLEVAIDLDAEADAMEAGATPDRRVRPRTHPLRTYEALLHADGPDAETIAAEIIDISAGGARLRLDHAPVAAGKVVLELPEHALRLDGTIVRMRGSDVAVMFDPDSSDRPALNRVLRNEAPADPVDAPAFDRHGNRDSKRTRALVRAENSVGAK